MPASTPIPKLDQILKTNVTDLLKIKHPVLLAGMGSVAAAPLAAAVSNAGGLGNIGGVGLEPATLRKEIHKLKNLLDDDTCFGVDLLLPQLDGKARKTNSDYTEGKLEELIDIIIEEKTRLFTSAVGVPPRWVVEKLHKAGILVMNMCGHPHHVDKALAVGVDMVCCQGYEAGGHTGEVGTMALIPMCLEKCKGRKSELHGGDVHVIAAGGIYNGRGVAASLALGADAVWVGTRFVASKEANAGDRHKDAVVSAGPSDTIRTVIYSGRPMRVVRNEHNSTWEKDPAKINHLVSQGSVPIQWEAKEAKKNNTPWSLAKVYPQIVGQAAGGIKSVQPAGLIVNEMVTEAAQILSQRATLVAKM
eukprot:TRINITY_DN2256_c1_g3_i1.p1 TRINITY_DN2256_c1_g3~~TRINITY_DN2256_c1_g3_i1.p1  ORF type:complete len:382 (+),score=72.93 TRINITY_DN2256_c1_g3_i1:64-1146(+)